MQWTEDLTVGVEKIDEQHKELFRRIEALVKSVKAKECKYQIGPTFKFLDDYIVTHFGDEEKIMQDSAYPKFEAHKALHEKFVRDFRALRAELEDEPSSYNRSVMTNQIVVDWIVDHIKQRDIEFGRFIGKSA